MDTNQAFSVTPPPFLVTLLNTHWHPLDTPWTLQFILDLDLFVLVRGFSWWYKTLPMNVSNTILILTQVEETWSLKELKLRVWGRIGKRSKLFCNFLKALQLIYSLTHKYATFSAQFIGSHSESSSPVMRRKEPRHLMLPRCSFLSDTDPSS